jgi:hypothetical protein
MRYGTMVSTTSQGVCLFEANTPSKAKAKAKAKADAEGTHRGASGAAASKSSFTPGRVFAAPGWGVGVVEGVFVFVNLVDHQKRTCVNLHSSMCMCVRPRERGADGPLGRRNQPPYYIYRYIDIDIMYILYIMHAPIVASRPFNFIYFISFIHSISVPSTASITHAPKYLYPPVPGSSLPSASYCLGSIRL